MLLRILQRTCLLAMGVCTSGCYVVMVDRPVVPVTARGVRLRADVSRGYAAYEAVLAPYGDWAPDDDQGIHWCPRNAEAFQPYVTRGRWTASDGPIGQAPAGSPEWVSEDSDTWGAITTRHGWWVRLEPNVGPRSWCWVPGTEETPGRVVWRTGDGFVGWAPESPTSCDDDDIEYDHLDWAYTLLGTLMDDALDGNLLDGDARDAARKATEPTRAGSAAAPSRHVVGPPAAKVGDARKALVAYAAQHAVTFAQAVAAVPKAAASGSGKSSSSSGSKSSDASGNAKSASQPSAAAYYDAMMSDPMYVPVGDMPRVAPSQALASLPAKSASLAAPSPAAHGGVGDGHAHGHAVSAPSHASSPALVSSPTPHPSSASTSYTSSSSSSHHASSHAWRSSSHHR